MATEEEWAQQHRPKSPRIGRALVYVPVAIDFAGRCPRSPLSSGGDGAGQLPAEAMLIIAQASVRIRADENSDGDGIPLSPRLGRRCVQSARVAAA